MFLFEPEERKVTKELLLNKNPEEYYFEYYLGIPVKKGLFISPEIIRIDHKPTCSFYKNSKGTLIYHDFTGIMFDFVGCVMYIYKCSYYKALRIIANDIGLIEIKDYNKHIQKLEYTGSKIKNTEKSKIQVEIKEFSKKELDWWNSFGISKNTLLKFKVYSIKSVFLNGNYFISSEENSPIYGYFGGLNSDEDELWRIYMPTKRNYRFLSNWSNTMYQGSKQLGKYKDCCIISKSMKDVMSLFELGFSAIAPTSETVIINKNKYEKLKKNFSEILIFYDNDLPGVKGAHKYKKEYPDCRCIFLRRKISKDISDLCKYKGLGRFLEAGEEIEQIIKDKTIKKTKHFYVF